MVTNVAAAESSRGLRFTGGLLEESVSIDPTILNEVLIPTLNVERRVNGKIDPNEIMNQAQTYVTTAGYKNTFSYDKLIQILCQSVAKPNEAMILGGSWRTPVMEGLLSRDFVSELKTDGTFNEASFDREYRLLYSLNIVNCGKPAMVIRSQGARLKSCSRFND